MQVRDELRVLVEAEVARAIENLEKFNNSLGNAEKKTKPLDKALANIKTESENATAGFDKMAKTIGSLVEVAAGLKALSVVRDMGIYALQTADSFQNARNQFGTLLGDMKAGAGLFNEIKAFNDKTPFDLSTLTQATNVLVAAKVPLKDLQVQLTKFGDLSQGNSQKLTSYVNAFSQAAAKGKADMQVLNTYIHQGVPILDALAKNFGVTTAEIVDMSSKGQIAFADFSRALDELTASGGQYFGGMELSSKSLAAMQEGLNEAVKSLAASFGEMLLPAGISTLGMFTDLTGAINENPIAKGILAAAITSVTALMGIMAVKATMLTVKTWLAQAAQMGLNASLAVTNPLLWAGIAAAAAATAGYVHYATSQQRAARAAEDNALAQRKLNEAMSGGLTAVQLYYQQAQDFNLDAALNELKQLQGKVDEQRRGGVVYSDEILNLRTAIERFKNLRDAFIKDYYDASADEKIKELQSKIRIAQTYMVTIDVPPEEEQKLQSVIADAREEIDKLTADMKLKAAGWRQTLQNVMNFSDGDIAAGLLNTGAGAIDEYSKRLEAAEERALSFDNILKDEASVLQNTAGQWEKLLAAMVESGQWERSEESIQKVIDKLEQAREAAGQAGAAQNIEELKQKITDFGKSEVELARDMALANKASSEQAGEIARLTGEYQRKEIIAEYDRQIKELGASQRDLALAAYEATGAIEAELAAFGEKFDELDAAQKAQKLKDTLDGIRDSLAGLGASAALSGIEALGSALGKGADAGDAMRDALTAMSQEILNALPNLFLQAGLQLIVGGQWALGLGFVAAAGSTALIKGYVGGRTGAEREAAQANALGNVFDAQGVKAFARGGTFTNQIVQSPTSFRFAKGTGLMGEAGPEAIVPLRRMASGSLGVETSGSGANVTVNIINNTGAEVHKEERDDGAGGKEIIVTIGEMVNNHIASGKADRVIGGRYGLQAQGV